MHHRETDLGDIDAAGLPFGDFVMASPPNWTAVGFLGLLGGLHLTVAATALAGGRREGFLSLAFGGLFALAAAAGSRFRTELALLRSRRHVRVRTGVGPFRVERVIPFRAVRAVRLTTAGGGRDSVIELLCPREDLLCPPTAVPRQQALLLAMTLGVPFVKVLGEGEPIDPRATAPEALSGRIH